MEVLAILCAVGFGLFTGVVSAYAYLKRKSGQMKKVSSTDNFEDILEKTIPSA
jgi:hypothetical protein